jgi:hypothetical protein
VWFSVCAVESVWIVVLSEGIGGGFSELSEDLILSSQVLEFESFWINVDKEDAWE